VEPIPQSRRLLDELARFGDDTTEAHLLALGRAARAVVPTCVGLSLGCQEEGLAFTLEATGDEIASMDAVQYLDGGPCVDSVREERVIEVNQADLLDEDRWRLYARATAAAGIASSLTLPIKRGDRVIGTINLYAAAPDAFVGHHDELAQVLGASAEDAIADADLSFSTREASMQAPRVLADQQDVDIALGIIADAHGVDIDDARERLRRAAARAGVSEVQAARTLKHLQSFDR
jgi:GAF domain-containing protein